MKEASELKDRLIKMVPPEEHKEQEANKFIDLRSLMNSR